MKINNTKITFSDRKRDEIVLVIGLFLCLILLIACSSDPPLAPHVSPKTDVPDSVPPPEPIFVFGIPEEIIIKARPCDGFDFPVNPPNAGAWYTYREIIEGEHYGEDWNSKAGGNSDFGQLVHSVGDGVVFYSQNFRPGWGNVIRIVHNIGTTENPEYVESLYAHLSSLWVKTGNVIKRGDPIGLIGTAEGVYAAHLHLEMRSQPNMSISWRDSAEVAKFLHPSVFIRKRRPE